MHSDNYPSSGVSAIAGDVRRHAIWEVVDRDRLAGSPDSGPANRDSLPCTMVP